MAAPGQVQPLVPRWMPPPRIPIFTGDPRDGSLATFVQEAENAVQNYQLVGTAAAELVMRSLEGECQARDQQSPGGATEHIRPGNTTPPGELQRQPQPVSG